MKASWFMKKLWTGLPCMILSISIAAALHVSPVAAQDAAAEPAAAATDAAAAPPASPTGEFAKDQLEQLVAPIALYPDTVLTQVLMASTYPLEVVEADRFMKKNKGLQGEDLNKALLEQDWDASIKALCSMPDTLAKMSENLDWTQDLGDAFLGQKTELMDTVQRMRGLAYEAGNLETTQEQTVTQEPDKIIVIESADPEIVYVPSYNSTVIYGSSWGYPSYYYPPMYYYPPGYGLISFGIGMAIGGAIWGNCNWGWGGSDIDIDINRYNEFNRNTNINADRDRLGNTGRDGKASWNHDASHRKGVNYRSQDVARRNGATSGTNRVSQNQARGRSNPSASNRASTANRPSTGNLQSSNRPATDRSSGAASNRASTNTNNRSASTRSSQSSRNSAYSGSRSPSADRMSSSRGASSRGATSFGGSRGGMRSGGGRRR